MSGALGGEAVLLTGGGSGIGRAVALRFAAEGADVVVLERDADKATGLTDAGVHVVVGDATERADVVDAVEATVDRFGKLDVLVANAGLHDHHRSLRSLSPEELDRGFDQLFAVNVKSVLLAAHCAVSHLRASRGSIIATVSPAGFEAGGGGPMYTASKHAVVGLIKQLAYELAPTVRVNGVAPGATRTNLAGPSALGGQDGAGSVFDEPAVLEAVLAVTPLQLLAAPEQHAGAYVLLASRRDGLAMTAEVIRSDGGMAVRVRPGLRSWEASVAR